MRHLDAKLVDVPAEGFPLAATIHESEPRERAKVWQCKILTDRLAEHETLQFAVFREQADAGRDGVAGRTDVERATVEDDIACVSLVSPEDQPQRFRTTSTDETSQCQDLPGPHRE